MNPQSKCDCCAGVEMRTKKIEPDLFGRVQKNSRPDLFGGGVKLPGGWAGPGELYVDADGGLMRAPTRRALTRLIVLTRLMRSG